MYCLINWAGAVQPFENLQEVVKTAYERERNGQVVTITYNGNLVYSTETNNEIIYNDCSIGGLYDTIADIRCCEIFLNYSFETGYTLLLLKDSKNKNLNWQNGF